MLETDSVVPERSILTFDSAIVAVPARFAAKVPDEEQGSGQPAGAPDDRDEERKREYERRGPHQQHGQDR